MLPRLFLVILLGFPLLELLVSGIVAHYIGWWIVLWFVLATLLGMLLLRGRRFFLVGNLMAALQSGRSPMQALFASGRLMLAAILLIIPGVLSDLLALLILLWPGSRPHSPRSARTPDASQAAPGVIEGEFKRE